MNSIYIGKPDVKCIFSEVFGTAMRMTAPIRWFNPDTGIEEVKECYFDVEKSGGGI